MLQQLREGACTEHVQPRLALKTVIDLAHVGPRGNEPSLTRLKQPLTNSSQSLLHEQPSLIYKDMETFGALDRQLNSVLDVRSEERPCARPDRSFASNARAILRRNFERRTDPIVQNPYRQMSSSFIVGNRDRFGVPYVPVRPQLRVPGPGHYESATQKKTHAF